MSNRFLLLGAASLALIGSALAAPARAADLDLPYLGTQSYPEDKVEFGSGWYIRGDIGGTQLPKITNTSAPLTGAPTEAIGTGSNVGYDASLGAGYKFNRWFRADLVADFHQPVTSSFSSASGSVPCTTSVYYLTDANGNVTRHTTDGGCSGTYTGKLQSYDVLVNGYIDLGTWYGVTPYVGAGLGLSFGHYQTASTYTQFDGTPYNISYTDSLANATFHGDYDHHSSGTYYNFAYALMAGVGIDIYDHTKLDIGYRYLNLGKIDGVSGTLYSHEVRAGVRYMIDD